MTNRIGGDFNAETMDAFRAAYAAQLSSPEDQDIDEYTGLPTNTVSNTSPWIEHTGLWKYPSGKGPDQDLQQPFNPETYLTSESAEENEEGDELSEEEVENLINELIPQEEEEEGDKENSDNDE